MRLVSRAPRGLVVVAGGALALAATTFAPPLATMIDRVGAFTMEASAGVQSRAGGTGSTGTPLKILFLGQNDAPQPHPAAAVFQSLAAPLARRGIQLTAAFTPEALVDRLSYYDGLILYGNHATLTPEQEKALLAFVDSGKGVVGIHSAIEMFGASPRYAALMGGQGKLSGGAEFTGEIVAPTHPAMQGVKPFASWDESVAYTGQGAADRTVLMERVDGGARTPYAWARTQGKGRVFYTAYGHDQRTWNNPGFHTLI